jgi:cell wall assembly regulator SMI1
MNDNPEWDARKAIQDVLATLRQQPEENEVSIAERELERAFPLAVKSLVNLALHSEDEKVRRLASLDLLNAGVKIRELSKDGTDELEKFMRSVSREIENE